MTEKSTSPFAGLDKALLRETQARPAGDTSGRARRLSNDGAPEPAATTPADPIAAIRQALRSVGKEIYYVRVTPAEKRRVDEATHTLKQQGIRTSANELGRIALNHLLADYEANGEASVLARVLADKRA